MMSEKDHAPLSAACVRALHDKLVEKRKTAACEIEKMVKEFAVNNKVGQIEKLLALCGHEFCNSQNPHAKKGGLLGLAAITVALGKDSSLYTKELIMPILGCFPDTDLRVRYYACEALYNVVKITRGAVLPHFGSIFNALAKLATDSEQSVKNASETLDRLMKDIVTENPSFEMSNFVPLLRDHIETNNTFGQQFVISWISVLDSVPNKDLIIYLPEILDGLFKLLDGTTMEIKKLCGTQLGEFLRRIKSNPEKAHFDKMMNILTVHANLVDELVQYTAITWIKEFVELAGPQMLPFMSGIFTAVFSFLAYDTESRKKIKECAMDVNNTLMKLISKIVEEGGEEALMPMFLKSPSLVGNKAVTDGDSTADKSFLKVIEVLQYNLSCNSVQTKVAVLKWILHLYTKIPVEMFKHIDEFFPTLLRTLSDPSDEVVLHCLEVIAKIISSPAGWEANDNNTVTKDIDANIPKNMSPFYSKFLVNLLKLFSTDKQLLEERGSFIIRQLCVLLNAEDIYRTLAQVLLTETNLKFASLMVENLGMILLTSSELFDLRNQLKELKTEESCSLFCCLYETWCHNPVATVALCLLTRSYSHACDLIHLFGTLEVTVEFLTEIDKLIQLIESPIFAYLRLDLLEVPCDQHLIRALYGLLMLLPQTDAFHTLKTRLACIPSLHLYCDNKNLMEIKNPLPHCRSIDFKKLLEHFVKVQNDHKLNKHMLRLKNLSSLERDGPDNPYYFI